MNEAAIKAADGAFRAGLLINGGAAVSVLAFIGSLATKELVVVSQLSRVAGSLEIFAYGVAAAVLGIGFSYLTHLFDADYYGAMKRIGDPPFTELSPASKRFRRFRNCTHWIACVLRLHRMLHRGNDFRARGNWALGALVRFH
jgi:hypothetical protein